MTGIDLAAPGLTVAAAALTVPKLLAADATVAEVRRFFADDHVHAALVISRDGVLLAVVEREDLPGAADGSPARAWGRLADRTVAGHQSLQAVAATMRAVRRRRVAVVDGGGRLLGLLCMKRDFSGFCSDSDVLARAQDADRCPG